MITVISLGGSIIAPGAVDTEYLANFKALIEGLLLEDAAARYVFVAGGGAPARAYQEAYRNVLKSAPPHCAGGVCSLPQGPSDEEADWIGIMATRLNAQLVRAVFAAHCAEPVVTDPSADFSWNSRILVASGWKPGFSSDNDAVFLAQRFGGALCVARRDVGVRRGYGVGAVIWSAAHGN